MQKILKKVEKGIDFDLGICYYKYVLRNKRKYYIKNIYKLVKNESRKQKKAVITSLLFCTKNGVKNIFKKLEKSIDTC